MPRLHSSLDAVARLAQASGMDIPEQLRTFAIAWADADAKAYELEAKKDAVLNRWAKELAGDLSVAAAEREVKASQRWHDHIGDIARARHEANKARGELDYWKAKFEAWLVAQAHAREIAA